MINLLPQKEKDVLYARQFGKLIVVLGTIVLVGFISLFLILLSVKLYILGQASYQKIMFENAQKSIQSPESVSLQAFISKYNSILAKENLFYEDQAYMSRILDILIGVPRPEGLYFTEISLNGDQENIEEVGIIISGTSATREGLTLFKKNVEEEQKIKDVYFPPESWINAKNISFNINLAILKKEVGNSNTVNE